VYLVDTHTHLFTENFQEDIEEVIIRAKENGIKKMCLPNINVSSMAPLNNLCERFSDVCFPMMGIHPTDINESYQEDLKTIREQFNKRKYIAVGEIGIDLYWDKTFLDQQIEAFEEQLRWSIELSLPVSIHTREAFPEVFNSLDKVGSDQLRGIFHSFTGSEEELDQVLSYDNFLIGINGVVTYKNSTLKNYLNKAPLERIVLETDAPYLTPVPFRGKRNEPTYLIYVLNQLAEIYNLTPEEIIMQTTLNAEGIFAF
jgi:hydrolase, TatD family